MKHILIVFCVFLRQPPAVYSVSGSQAFSFSSWSLRGGAGGGRGEWFVYVHTNSKHHSCGSASQSQARF